MGVASKPLVLVVDDDTDFRESVCMTLRESGFETEQAQDGVEALNRLFEDPTPDAILLDMMMPRMDGLSFIAALYQTEFYSVPVVLMTAAGQKAVKIASVVRDVQGMLPSEVLDKPLTADVIVSAIRRSIQKS